MEVTNYRGKWGENVQIEQELLSLFFSEKDQRIEQEKNKVAWGVALQVRYVARKSK